MHTYQIIYFICITYRISVDRNGNGRKRIKMKTMTENITGACVCSMRMEFNLCHNVQFYRFRYLLSVDSRKIIKTVMGTKID